MLALTFVIFQLKRKLWLLRAESWLFIRNLFTWGRFLLLLIFWLILLLISRLNIDLGTTFSDWTRLLDLTFTFYFNSFGSRFFLLRLPTQFSTQRLCSGVQSLVLRNCFVTTLITFDRVVLTRGLLMLYRDFWWIKICEGKFFCIACVCLFRNNIGFVSVCDWSLLSSFGSRLWLP